MLHAARVFLSAFLLVLTSPVAASDFWEEVASPGLRRHREALAEAERALQGRLFVDALAAADRAVLARGDRATAHVLRARALSKLDRRGEALDAYKRALELDRGALGTLREAITASELALDQGAMDLAREILERCVGRAPPSAMRRQAYVLLGDVLSSSGPEHLAGALAAYREALRGIGIPEVRSALGLALSLRRSGELRESLALVRAVAFRGPVEPALARVPLPRSERAARRALVLEALGDHAGALSAWKEASRSEPWGHLAREELAGLGAAREEE